MESIEHKEGIREIANIPNLATLARLVIASHVSYVLLSDGPSMSLGLEYAGGMVLDAFDGWYARKFDQCTKFGKVFDPIVDFTSFHLPLLAYGAAYIGSDNPLHVALPIGTSAFIAVRDITLFQQYLSTPKDERDGYHVSRIGKVKTAVQMATVTALITLPESYEALQEFISRNIESSTLEKYYSLVREKIIDGGLTASLAFSLLSGFGYMQKIKAKMRFGCKKKDKGIATERGE